MPGMHQFWIKSCNEFPLNVNQISQKWKKIAPFILGGYGGTQSSHEQRRNESRKGKKNKMADILPESNLRLVANYILISE